LCEGVEIFRTGTDKRNSIQISHGAPSDIFWDRVSLKGQLKWGHIPKGFEIRNSV